MYNLNARGGRRRRRARRLGRRNLGWLIALGAAVPVVITGYWLAAPGARSAVPAATVLAADGGDVLTWTTSPPQPWVGGWGEGGYPMVAEGGLGGAGTASGGPTTRDAANAAAVTNVTSANWAGYAATGAAGAFTSVSASWAQPAVTCGATATFSSFWAGLDGDGTPTVEQTGTEADCANGAAAAPGNSAAPTTGDPGPGGGMDW